MKTRESLSGSKRGIRATSAPRRYKVSENSECSRFAITLRQNVLLIIMPVFFLSTGLRTTWTMGGTAVFLVAGILLVASISGKLLGVRMAGAILHWQPGESSLIGWLLQTKALIMIIFVNVLLDKGIITSTTFTALLLMAVGSTMLTIPLATPKLQRLRKVIFKTV